jgi:hypothetical protein
MGGTAGNVIFYGNSDTKNTNVAAILKYEMGTNLPPL